MSGFTTRRFLLHNISAVLEHTPLPLASTAARVLVSSNGQRTAAFALVTADELAFIRKQREDEAQESRLVLSTRPTRSIARGLGGAALNLVLGLLLSPLIAFSVFLERLRVSHGAIGLLSAPLVGPAWGAVFLLTAVYAAAQQVLLSVYYAFLASPSAFCLNRRPHASAADHASAAPATAATVTARFWSPLACRFEAPYGRLHAIHPLLEHAPSDRTLRERGLKRLSQRRQREEKQAEYMGKGTRAGGADGTADDDYYALLGVEKNATEKEIKGAFNRLVLKLHPDRNPSPKAAQHFDQVTKAYRVLSHPEKRRKYDMGGVKGVEDLGAKKREGVRAVFGGEELAKLAGDVLIGSFSQRVIDGVDLTQEEIEVLRARMQQQCRDQLLDHYLAHYRGHHHKQQHAQSPASGSAQAESARGRVAAVADDAWAPEMKAQLRKLLRVGLAKEVLFVLGHAYARTVAYYDAEQAPPADGQVEGLVSTPTLIVRRTRLYCGELLPHRLRLWRTQMTVFATVRTSSFKNPEAMIDLAWHASIADLERTAQTVARAVLYDPSLTAEESLARRDALAALSALFIHYGQVYKGANKHTMDELMSSLRDYQQQRQREKNQ